MQTWFWELMLIAPVALLGGRLLHRFLNRLAPRSWPERYLPAPAGDSANLLGAEFSLYIVLAVIGLSIFTVYSTSGMPWLKVSGPLTMLVAFVWGLYSLVHLRLWWILDQGSPLRASLDALSQKTGILPRRVRLREEHRRLPRVFLDGSLELSTSFFANLPDDEQAFLQTAALHQLRTYQGLRRLGALAGVYIAVSVVIGSLCIYLWKSSLPFMVGMLPLHTYLLARFNRLPAYSDATLRFALEATENLEAAKRAIRRLDPRDAESRLEALDSWWNARQPALSPVGLPVASVAAPVQQQTLGRKP